VADIYKIGLSLMMSSNHAQVLSALSQHLLGVHANVDKLQEKFSKLKLAIAGAFAVTAGMTIFRGMEDLLKRMTFSRYSALIFAALMMGHHLSISAL
jgi:hypothetical protein